ncbi:GNAT family N-acetyltransferase [Desulfocurvus sp. DL9XJH121]
MHAIHITSAKRKDLKKILELQYIAYQSEAILLNNFSIPPLEETLDDVERQFREGVILKAVDKEGKIIGSVRGRPDDDTLLIGKLIVHPDFQGQGIGSRLLTEIERQCPRPRYELFTSDRSAKNLSLYERKGYVRFQQRQAAPGLTLVYLEKFSAA